MTEAGGSAPHGARGEQDDEWATERERLERRREVARQARALPAEPLGHAARTALAVATVSWLAALVWLAVTLPARVPQHWGSTGDVPDSWADRSTALVTSALIPVVVVYPMLLLGRLPLRWPDAVNVPGKEWWLAEPERARRFERLVREDVALVVAISLGVVTAADVVIGLAAHRPGGAVPEGVFVVVLAVFLLAMGGVVGRMVLGGRYAPGNRVD